MSIKVDSLLSHLNYISTDIVTFSSDAMLDNVGGEVSGNVAGDMACDTWHVMWQMTW